MLSGCPRIGKVCECRIPLTATTPESLAKLSASNGTKSTRQIGLRSLIRANPYTGEPVYEPYHKLLRITKAASVQPDYIILIIGDDDDGKIGDIEAMELARIEDGLTDVGERARPADVTTSPAVVKERPGRSIIATPNASRHAPNPLAPANFCAATTPRPCFDEASRSLLRG